MSQQLINHSPDLKRLRDEGYEVEIRGGHLIVRHVPYVNKAKEVRFGVLVSALTLASTIQTGKPGTHVIFFQGEYPCDKDGRMITAIQHGSNTQTLASNVEVNFSFSNKPPNGYANYYDKVTRCIEIISAPAFANASTYRSG